MNSSDDASAQAYNRKKRTTIHNSEKDLPRAELRQRSVLRTLVRRNARSLSVYIVLSLINETVHMSVPIVLGYIIDHGIIAGDLRFTVLVTLTVIVMRLLAMWAWAISFYGVMEIRVREQHNLRLAVTAAALHPDSAPVDRPSGEVLSIATSDADRAPDIFDMIGWALSASVAVVAAGVWLLWVNVWLGLAVFTGLAIQVLTLRYITPVLSQKYDAQQSKAADAASTATDLVHGLRVLQGLGVQSRAREVYRTRSRTALKAALINARFSGISSGLMTLISGLMIAAVVLIAGTFTLEGVIGVGMLISVAGLVRNMSGMMEGLSGVPVWFASFSTSARRVRHLLSEMGRSLQDPVVEAAVSANAISKNNTATPATALSQAQGAASISTLPGTQEETHHDAVRPRVASIHSDTIGKVHSGEVITIVTATAADAAAVLADLAHIDADRNALLMEPHAVDLFDGTVREQLATGNPSALNSSTDAWAYDALHAAGADDLLEILPGGLDERIIDRGANLSGGQRQRLALARAIAADPPVLVLHDPTTAVDAVTEQKIAQALTEHRASAGRITIIVTKAPALLHEAHRVLFVQGGTVTETGTHHALMSHATYAEVVQR